MANEAINSFIAAEDPSEYVRVCDEANNAEIWGALIPYLHMCRKTIKENMLDTELIYALAKTDAMTELEEFVSGPNCANIQNIGDRCFGEGMYGAAKLMYISINNNARLALCHIHLEEYREAVAAAGKANAVATWKSVCWACVKASEFKLAASCGLQVICHPDHLDELVGFYEQNGHYEELIELMEQGLGSDNAHMGIFTELAILYSKYQPDKLMDHIKIFITRMNVVKVVKACERARLWEEATYCYIKDKQYDSAAKTMLERITAFNHEQFLDIIVKVRNQELIYKSVTFYFTHQPDNFVKLLTIITPQLDHTRCVHLLKQSGEVALKLAQPYLRDVQSENISAVNTALNELYLNDEDYECLRTSIDEHNNFDQIALAQKIESHELLEFRRIAAYVYRKNKRWEQSIQLSKHDKMFKDSIDTAAESGKSDLVESLMKFFCEMSEKECFCATLYTCYDLVSPDVALELGWRNGYVDFIMPFMIETFRQTHTKLIEIEKKLNPDESEVQKDDMANAYGQMGYQNNMLMLTNGGMGFADGQAGGANMPGGMASPMGMPPPNIGMMSMQNMQNGMSNGVPNTMQTGM